MSLFAQGGVAEGVRDEIEHGFSADILSLDDFMRAEQNLERTPITLDEIELANVMATTFAEDDHEWHTFLYSQKETGREQNNGPGDENTETALGRRKVGIQDPDAFRKEQEKRRTSRLAVNIANEQQMYLERLNIQIEQLNRELEELYAKREELDELQESLGYINEQTARGRDARRKWDEYLQRTGRGSLDQHTGRDGQIDADSLDDISDADIRDTDTKIEDTERERDNLMEQYENASNGNSYRSSFDADNAASGGSSLAYLDSAGSAFESKNSSFSGGFSEGPTNVAATEAELAAIDSQMGGASSPAFGADSSTVSAFASMDSAFDSGAPEAFGGSDQDIHLTSADSAFDEPAAFDSAFDEPVEFDQVAQMESFDAGSAFGSFSGSGEENTNVITDHFASKVAAIDETTQPNITLDETLDNGQPAVATMRV